jgi:hypothetical protein
MTVCTMQYLYNGLALMCIFEEFIDNLGNLDIKILELYSKQYNNWSQDCPSHLKN